MRNWKLTAMSLGLLAGLVASTAAQESDVKITALRTKDVLTEEEKVAVREWVAKQVASIATNDAAGAQTSFAQLRESLGGGRDFRETSVAACLESIASAYKKAEIVPAARLIGVLNLLNDNRTLPLLLEVLQDDRAAVRAAAAIALRSLRPRLAVEADAYNRTLAALREAAKKEPSRETLQLLYRAMNFVELQPTPDLKPVLAALLDVLDERARQYAGEKVRAEAADTVALELGAGLRRVMDDNDKKRYAAAAARMMYYAVRRYACGELPLGKALDKSSSADTIALRNAVELLIREAERQLVELLSPTPAPQVTDKMSRAQRVDMVIEMNRFVPVLNDKLGLNLTPLNEAPSDESTGAPATKPSKP